MVGVTMTGTYEGKPLEVLGKLIEERKRVLGESAEDAVVATGIDALISLRALTKTAKKMIPKADVRFGREDPQYITGTRGKSIGKLFRRTLVKRWSNGRQTQTVRWQRVESMAKDRRATSADLTAAWKRFGKIRNRGLARRALGVAMNRLSTRNVALGQADMRLARLANASVAVVKSGTNSSFSLRISDNLGYAQQALKGGPAAVELALQKAANKVAGRLCKVAEKKFGERISTPFPEVKDRRAK